MTMEMMMVILEIPIKELTKLIIIRRNKEMMLMIKNI
jgi:hypothetical protein